MIYFPYYLILSLLLTLVVPSHTYRRESKIVLKGFESKVLYHVHEKQGFQGMGYYRGGYVEVTKLYKHKKEFADLIVLKRSGGKVKAKYFAFDRVFDRFQDIKRKRDIVLIFSGAFTDFRGQPIGLTVDSGRIVNRLFNNSLDGIVIIDPSGTIVVGDAESGNIYTQGGKKLNLKNQADQLAFLNWTVQNSMTVFQTQLLIYRNKLKLDILKARTELASRRIWASAMDKEGNIYHFVFNICQDVYLGDAVKDVEEFIRITRQMEIVSMLNFDTGAKDIIRFFDDSGRIKLLGTNGISIQNAANLMIYYYEK